MAIAIQFFEFQQKRDQNRQGIPSDYTGPFSGTYYLWNRTQQQALKLLERYDYAGAYDVLAPYIKQDSNGFGAIPTWLASWYGLEPGRIFHLFSNMQKVRCHHWPKSRGNNGGGWLMNKLS